MQPGPKPSWFKQECARIVQEDKLIEFVGRVAKGEEKEERISEGVIIEVKASLHDRLDAFEMLCNWGFGKPVLISDDSGQNVLGLAKTEVMNLFGELGIVVNPDNSKSVR